MTTLKYDLKTVSGLSNYRATLDQQMVNIVNSRSSSDEIWLYKVANLLNSWFRAEHLLLTPASPKLLELFQQLDDNLLKLKD